jgi:hypothetical protein
VTTKPLCPHTWIYWYFVVNPRRRHVHWNLLYIRFRKTCLLWGFTFTFIVRIIILVFVPGRSRVVQKLKSGFVPDTSVAEMKFPLLLTSTLTDDSRASTVTNKTYLLCVLKFASRHGVSVYARNPTRPVRRYTLVMLQYTCNTLVMLQYTCCDASVYYFSNLLWTRVHFYTPPLVYSGKTVQRVNNKNTLNNLPHPRVPHD